MKPEVSHPTRVCPNPQLWRCYDSEATEVEVLAFLRALVVLLKPRLVIETGCYNGHGTEQLVLGLKDNGYGHVFTCDIGADKLAATKDKLWYLPSEYYTLQPGTGVQLIDSLPECIDFAFLDSGPDGVRIEELRALLPKLNPEGVVAIHDVGPQHGLRAHFDLAMEDLGLQHIIFSTPRGLALVRRKQA